MTNDALARSYPIDFIPTEQYGGDEAARAIEDARFVFAVAERVIGGSRS